MGRSVVRAGVDTYAVEDKPGKNYHQGTQLRVQQSEKQAYIRFKSPAPKGATILSAKLVLTQAGDYGVPGETVTVGIARVAAPWTAPRLTWSNRPLAVDAEAPSNWTNTNPQGGKVWEFDVTAKLQTIANGGANNGFQIACNRATEIRFHSMNATGKRPYLEVNWTTAPQKPTQLKPAGGIVSSPKPILSCDYTDRSGSRDLHAIQVQIDAVADFAAPDWDSGAVLVAEPLLDLSTTSYPGLGEGEATAWRVRVQDGDGLWSQWSDPVAFMYRAKGVLTITSPAPEPNNFVWEFTPPISWDFTAPQSHYRVAIAAAATPTRLIYDSEKLPSDENTHTIPRGVLKDDQAYRVYVQVWDTYQDREATSGSPTYVGAFRDFVVDYDAVIAGAETLTATPHPSAPWVDLVFTRDASPDSWTILRDNVAIETDLEPADLVDLDGVTYRYRDVGARPEMEHVYRAVPEVNGKLSASVLSASATPKGVGIWILDPATNTALVLGGREYGSAEATDQAETFSVLGSSAVVRSVMGLNGMSGQCSDLMLRDRPELGMTWDLIEKRLYAYKSRATDEYRLIMGDLNIPVVLADIVISPDPRTIAGSVLKRVSFSWWQTREHPFEMRV